MRWYLAFSVAVLFAVSGCGDGGEPEQEPELSSAEYQEAIIEILADSQNATTLFFSVVANRQPTDECAENVESLYLEVQDLVERAADLRPPEDVGSIHSDFVAPAEESVERVAEIQDQVESGEVSCGRQLNDLLYGMPSTEDAEEAISRLEDRGYFVFGE